MSCPFYAHALHPPFMSRGEWIFARNPGSNQCALIVDAHSPCVMEVLERTAPEWSACSRNPALTIEPVRKMINDVAVVENQVPHKVVFALLCTALTHRNPGGEQ